MANDSPNVSGIKFLLGLKRRIMHIKHRGSVFFHTLGRKMKLAVINFANTFTAQHPCLALVQASIKTYIYIYTYAYIDIVAAN